MKLLKIFCVILLVSPLFVLNVPLRKACRTQCHITFQIPDSRKRPELQGRLAENPLTILRREEIHLIPHHCEGL